MPTIGIVGHHRTIAITESILEKAFPSVTAVSIPLDNMDIGPIISHLKENEQAYDGLLFTGKVPYDLINSQMVSEKPWVYLRHSTERLLSGLLECRTRFDYDISRISLDSYQDEEVLPLYESAGFSSESLDIHIAHIPIYDHEFLSRVTDFHRVNYYDHQASICITGISRVYEELMEEAIPVMILDPTVSSIETALKLLEAKQFYKKNSNSQIAVIALERDLPDEHTQIRENEYQLALESMKISEEIYLFSQRIQAAVIEKGLGKYLLFTTKYLFELETEELQQINILTNRLPRSLGTLSIGIGYGDTAREAKYYANLGLLKAKKQGGNQAYKVEHNRYYGPLLHRNTGTERPPLDGDFQKAATITNLSLNAIVKLQTIIDIQKSDTFTTSELASLYGISHRSMNRLIEKLLRSGHAEIVGNSVQRTSGRPSRIIRLSLKG